MQHTTLYIVFYKAPWHDHDVVYAIYHDGDKATEASDNIIITYGWPSRVQRVRTAD